MRILPYLPDWLNPVFVKDIRHTFKRTSFRVLNILLLLGTSLITLPERNDAAHHDTAYRAVLVFCNFVLFLQSMSMVNYWAKENTLEQLTPQKATSLSTFRILTGRLSSLLCSLVIVELCCLIPGILFKPDQFLRSDTFLLLTFNLLLFLTWSSSLAFITMSDPYAKTSRIHTGTINFIATVVYLFDILPLSSDRALLHHGTIWLLLCFFFGIAILFWYTKFAAPEANRMLPLRAGGLILFLLCYALAQNFLLPENFMYAKMVLCITFCIVQILLLVADPLQAAKRMELDAPQNPIAKGIWYSCGTGSLNAWLYGIPVLILITCLLEWNPFFIVGLAYLIIYAALTMWIRLAFPRFPARKGNLLLIGISALAMIVDFLLIATAGSFIFISPLSVWLMLLFIIIANLSTLLILAVNTLFIRDFSAIEIIIAAEAEKIQQSLYTFSTILAIIAAGFAVITIVAIAICNKKRKP